MPSRLDKHAGEFRGIRDQRLISQKAYLSQQKYVTQARFKGATELDLFLLIDSARESWRVYVSKDSKKRIESFDVTILRESIGPRES